LINLECVVKDIIYLGQDAGAGNLVICDVKYFHADDSILNSDKTQIDQTKINHVARLGGDWYAKINSSNLFTLPKPNRHNGMGFDKLPQQVLDTPFLTNNQKAALANIEKLPDVQAGFGDDTTKNIFQYFNMDDETLTKELFVYAATLIDKNEVERAWQVIFLIT
jgi:hypothetical protein